LYRLRLAETSADELARRLAPDRGEDDVRALADVARSYLRSRGTPV
jgi:hypothetical protein